MSDEPVVVSFKELKKKKLHLTENLKDSYSAGLARLKSAKRRSNDPRFDHRVNGECNIEDWAFLKDDRKATKAKLKKKLKETTNAKLKEKLTDALHLIRQREATEKDIQFRKSSINKLQQDQMDQLRSGKRVKFLNRAELRRQLQEERMKNMSKKQRERYLSRLKTKRSSNLDEETTDL